MMTNNLVLRMRGINAQNHKLAILCNRRFASTLPRIPLFEVLTKHDKDSTAVIHSKTSRTYTYGQLRADVALQAEKIRTNTKLTTQHVEGERIALLVENSYDYIVNFLSILANNAVAVPLSPAFPVGELHYVLDHSKACTLLYSSRFTAKAKDVLRSLESEGARSVQGILVEKLLDRPGNHDEVTVDSHQREQKGGLILYTSGTTSRPKGVVLPISALTAQCQSLHEAWRYSPADHLLHILPLHHIHGVVNGVLTPLHAGSAIEFLYPFSPDAVWSRLSALFVQQERPVEQSFKPITFFTAVPTVYNRLLSTYPSLPDLTKDGLKKALHPSVLRLNMAGSAALPTPVKQAWSDLTGGNVLLERYGMTEVGMALSCGLDVTERIDGSVGWPLPQVQARLMSIDNDAHEIIPEDKLSDALGKPLQGEIQLKGPTIFKEYWDNAEATRKEFTSDGWFKTGDVAVRKHFKQDKGLSARWMRGPAWYILGRQSADIIKTGGEKISALEVEREILSLSEIDEVAVLGIDNERWGQQVVAVVVLSSEGKKAGRKNTSLSLLDLRRLLKERLVAYKLPHEMLVVDEIPRNAMGKVNKKELAKTLFGSTKT